MARPRVKLDLAELEKLCVLQCTQPEIAAFFGVSLKTVEKRAMNPAFREVMDRGYQKGKISVRRKQMQLLEAGDKTMAIWLGKQLLGQRDQHAHELTGKNGSSLIPMAVWDEMMKAAADDGGSS